MGRLPALVLAAAVSVVLAQLENDDQIGDATGVDQEIAASSTSTATATTTSTTTNSTGWSSSTTAGFVSWHQEGCEASIENVTDSWRERYHEKTNDFVVKALQINGIQLLVISLVILVLLLLQRTRRVLAPKRPMETKSFCSFLRCIQEVLRPQAAHAATTEGLVEQLAASAAAASRGRRQTMRGGADGRNGEAAHGGDEMSTEAQFVDYHDGARDEPPQFKSHHDAADSIKAAKSHNGHGLEAPELGPRRSVETIVQVLRDVLAVSKAQDSSPPTPRVEAAPAHGDEPRKADEVPPAPADGTEGQKVDKVPAAPADGAEERKPDEVPADPPDSAEARKPDEVPADPPDSAEARKPDEVLAASADGAEARKSDEGERAPPPPAADPPAEKPAPGGPYRLWKSDASIRSSIVQGDPSAVALLRRLGFREEEDSFCLYPRKREPTRAATTKEPRGFDRHATPASIMTGEDDCLYVPDPLQRGVSSGNVVPRAGGVHPSGLVAAEVRELQLALHDHSIFRDLVSELSSVVQACADYVPERSSIGIDGQVIIHFCDLGFRFSLVGMFLGLILVPVYASSPNIDGDLEDQGFLFFTVANIVDDDTDRLWVVAVAAYLMAVVLMVLMRYEWHSFVAMRRRHLKHRAQGKRGASAAQAHYSIMVEQVPKWAQNAESLRQRFVDVFGADHVHSSLLQEDTVEKWHVFVLRGGDQRESSECTAGQRHCCGRQAIRCYRRCCRHFKQARDIGVRGVVKIERQSVTWIRQAWAGPSSTAFVTLADARERAIAEQVVLFSRKVEDLSDFLIKPAPERDDIRWWNASMPKAELDQRRRLGALMLLFAMLFWSVPVVAIQEVSGLNYQEYAPRTVQFLKSINFYDFFVGYLPALLLMVLLWSLPEVLHFVAERFEGLKVRQQIERYVLQWNLRFNIATLYVTVLAQSILTTLSVVAHQPACIFDILGTSIPAVSPYFTTFVIVRAGTSLPILLLGPIVQLLLRPWRLGRTFCGTLEDSDLSVRAGLAGEATEVTVVFILAVTYSVISPLTLVPCAVYFGLARFVYRWLFRNVYAPEFDCAGMLWVDMYNGAMSGLLLSTMSLVGFLMVHVDAQNQLKWTLYWAPVLLLVFLIAHRQRRQLAFYWPMYRAMPYEDAAEVDRDESEFGSAAVVQTFRKDYYKDWILSFIEGLDDDIMKGDSELSVLSEEKPMGDGIWLPFGARLPLGGASDPVAGNGASPTTVGRSTPAEPAGPAGEGGAAGQETRMPWLGWAPRQSFRSVSSGRGAPKASTAAKAKPSSTVAVAAADTVEVQDELRLAAVVVQEHRGTAPGGGPDGAQGSAEPPLGADQMGLEDEAASSASGDALPGGVDTASSEPG